MWSMAQKGQRGFKPSMARTLKSICRAPAISSSGFPMMSAVVELPLTLEAGEVDKPWMSALKRASSGLSGMMDGTSRHDRCAAPRGSLLDSSANGSPRNMVRKPPSSPMPASTRFASSLGTAKVEQDIEIAAGKTLRAESWRWEPVHRSQRRVFNRRAGGAGQCRD